VFAAALTRYVEVSLAQLLRRGRAGPSAQDEHAAWAPKRCARRACLLPLCPLQTGGKCPRDSLVKVLRVGIVSGARSSAVEAPLTAVSLREDPAR
jgi:hypothetical protein